MVLLSSTTSGTADLGARENQREVQESVLLTVLYADLFDYPLTRDELYRRLVDCEVSRDQFRRAVDSLTGRYLHRSGDFIAWRGRAYLVEQRLRREHLARDVWPIAERYGRWLRWIPFVRMVAVSGSLALDNNASDSDIDLFCVTDSRRLWIARLWLVFLSRLTRLFSNVFPRYLCPNYLLTSGALRLEDRNLFTAYEAVQAVPLWGKDVYHRFIQANPWMERYLPHSCQEIRETAEDEPRKPRLVRGCERLLGGRFGDIVDRGIFRIFLFGYRKRAERRGWTWSQLEDAYRRDRYTVPEGGYIRVVRRHFSERVRERLGERVTAGRLSKLFPGDGDQEESSNYDWTELFEREYGRVDTSDES